MPFGNLQFTKIGCLFTFRQVVAVGKDPSEDEVEKIELECVSYTCLVAYFEVEETLASCCCCLL